MKLYGSSRFVLFLLLTLFSGYTFAGNEFLCVKKKGAVSVRGSCGMEEKVFSTQPSCTQSHAYKYEYKSVPLGTIVSVMGDDYRIMKFPFVEFKTGERYGLTMPVRIDKPRSDGFVALYTTTHNPDDGVLVCSQDYDGIQLAFSLVDNLGHYYYMLGINSGEFDRGARINLHAKIGETSLEVSFSVSDKFIYVPNTENFDFTDDAVWDELRHPDESIVAVKKLMNYVRIEKL